MSPKPKKTDPDAPDKKLYPWHAKTVDECIQELGLSSDLLKNGLSTEEAKKRLADYGPNKMSEKEKVTLLQRIWHHVANVLVGILVFVAVVSVIRAITSTTVQNIISN